MTADELHQLADWLLQDGTEQHNRAAAYLRACADALENGPVAWAATDETGTVVEGLSMNQSRRFSDPLYLYPLAMPALRLPEPMTKAELLAIRMKSSASPEAEMTNWPALACRAVEAEVLRRVKEVNK